MPFHPTITLRTTRDIPRHLLRFRCNFYCAKCGLKVLPGNAIYFFGKNGTGEDTAPAIWATPELHPFDNDLPVSPDLPDVKYGEWVPCIKGLGRELLCAKGHFVGCVSFDGVETPRVGKIAFRAKFYYSRWTGAKSPILNTDMYDAYIRRTSEDIYRRTSKGLINVNDIYYEGPDTDLAVEKNARRLLEQIAESDTKDLLSNILENNNFHAKEWSILQYGFAIWLKSKRKIPLRELQVIFQECILKCQKFRKLKDDYFEVYEILIADFLSAIKWLLKDDQLDRKAFINLARKVYDHTKTGDRPPHRKITTFMIDILSYGEHNELQIDRLYNESTDHIYVYNKYNSLRLKWEDMLNSALEKFNDTLAPSTFRALHYKADEQQQTILQ